MELESFRPYLPHLAVLSGSLITVYFIIYKIRQYKKKKSLGQKVNDIEEHKMKLYQKLVGLKTPLINKDKLTVKCFKELHECFQEGSADFQSVIDVLEAFQAHGLDVNCKLNFVAEVVYDADVLALMLDSEIGELNRKAYPLMGMPVCFAEPIKISNMENCLGLTSQMTVSRATEDAVVVQVLKNMKALPIFKANVSFAGLGDTRLRCATKLYGETQNVLDEHRCVGGSAGGVASAVASKACVAGLAVDFGVAGVDSLLIAASFSGLAAIRLTPGRVSTKGIHRVLTANPLRSAGVTVGAMAREMSALVATVRSLCSEEMYQLDPSLAPLTFNHKLFKSTAPQRVGYFYGIHVPGFAECIPAVKHGVDSAIESLRENHQSDYELVPLENELSQMLQEFGQFWHLNLADFLLSLSLPDGGRGLLPYLANDVIDASAQVAVLHWKMPYYLKTTLSFLLQPFAGKYARQLRHYSGLPNISNLQLHFTQLKDLQQRFLALLHAHALDALMGPIFPIASPTKDIWGNFEASCFSLYSQLFAVLDVVSGVVPVHKVTAQDIAELLNQNPHDYSAALMEDQKHTQGLPIAVQLIAAPFHEESCLRAMKALAKVVPK